MGNSRNSSRAIQMRVTILNLTNNPLLFYGRLYCISLESITLILFYFIIFIPGSRKFLLREGLLTSGSTSFYIFPNKGTK